MALDFIAGCLGGCAGVAIGHPFDTVKVKLQTQDFKNPVYKGTWDCFTKILRTESVAGMYRGVSSPMCGVALVNAIVFGVYGNLQRRFTDPDSLQSQFLAGATAGLAQSIVSSPVELFKTRMQISSTYTSTVDCLIKIFRDEGVRGLFKGLSITGAREFLGYGFYFATYEAMTKTTPEEGPVGTPMMLLAGGVSGTVSWVLTYPIDVIKTRFQADSGTYTGLTDCLKKSVQNEGLSCLSRGLMPTIIRAFPTNAVTFTVVTWILRFANSTENEAVNITNIVESVVETIPHKKNVINNAELVDKPVENVHFNWILKMNAQRYFLMSEDLWVNDNNDEFYNESFHEDFLEKRMQHQENENKLGADLIAAELKTFEDFAKASNEHDFDVHNKSTQDKEESKIDHR